MFANFEKSVKATLSGVKEKLKGVRAKRSHVERIHLLRSLNVLEGFVKLFGLLQFTFIVEPEESKSGWSIREW